LVFAALFLEKGFQRRDFRFVQETQLDLPTAQPDAARRETLIRAVYKLDHVRLTPHDKRSWILRHGAGTK
jgi:hypothetical protein